RAKRLGQQLERRHADRDFARARAEERTGDADDVAEVEQVQHQESLVAQLIAAQIQLNPASLIGEMRKCSLAMTAPGHQTPRDANRTGFGRVAQMRDRLRDAVRALVSIRERLDAQLAQALELFASCLQDEVEILRAHAAASLAPNFLR